MKKKVIAITGPSGVGKSTLGDLLIERQQFVCPVHTTTRTPRLDDRLYFYNYLSHSEFNNHVKNDAFLFWSGDNDIVAKENGNFYGVLHKDYKQVEKYDKIIMFISYKDIFNIINLNKKGYEIDIINLIYDDINKSMFNRLLSPERNHSIEDINSRILSAKKYEEQFSETISSMGILKIPTDMYSIEETYNIIKKRVLR
ncbi:MAG: hypothetical protein ACI31R_06300 [Bacilli bacterium]